MSLRNICENQDKACSKLGERAAEQLKRLLADLRIVDSVLDVPAVQLEESKRGTRVAISFCAGCCMTIAPNQKKVPVSDSGRVDWRSVTRIQILKIEASNG